LLDKAQVLLNTFCIQNGSATQYGGKFADKLQAA